MSTSHRRVLSLSSHATITALSSIPMHSSPAAFILLLAPLHTTLVLVDQHRKSGLMSMTRGGK